MGPDDELRHCLTVVSGYLGLLLDDPAGMGPEQCTWAERAAQAAGRAAALVEVPLSPVAPAAPAA